MQIFKIDKDGQENLLSTAKTLTESGITIGVSAEDVRAGAGAKLYGKYFHTSTFDLKMTDAMFKLEYIAANVGSEIDLGGEVFTTEEVKATTANKLTLKYAPLPLKGAGCDATYIYYRKVGEDVWATAKVAEKGTAATKEVTVTGIKENATYCVKYVYLNDNAKTLKVSANFIPDTLRVYLTMNLFSGDDKNPQTGTKVGTVTVMVPRFLLNGTQDLSMSMTGASTTSFEGSALAAEECGAGGCESDGIYAKIVEVINGFTWTENVADIIVEGGYEKKEADEVVVYATINGGVAKKLKTEATIEADGYTLTIGETTAKKKTVTANFGSGDNKKTFTKDITITDAA